MKTAAERLESSSPSPSVLINEEIMISAKEAVKKVEELKANKTSIKVEAVKFFIATKVKPLIEAKIQDLKYGTVVDLDPNIDYAIFRAVIEDQLGYIITASTPFNCFISWDLRSKKI